MKSEELNSWFENIREVLETAYLAAEEPWKQSGMSGPENRWVSLRKPVADCIDKPGSFLDIGCANGYLLECCTRWTAERGIKIDPYGLDISPKLIELARRRLPQFASHFFTGNAFRWLPPRRFDFVRTELIYVPAEYEK
ncbi:MAG: class I SAM-dependent methyltransferase, partial [Dehalococcoidales bacterium]